MMSQPTPFKNCPACGGPLKTRKDGRRECGSCEAIAVDGAVRMNQQQPFQFCAGVGYVVRER